jgi:predicted benzoate:H+ symporter BenE
MKHTSIIVAVGLALIAALSAAPANALSGRTFVSPTGSDSNPCSLALPCRNLQAALYQTNPGGEIAILGTAGYSGGATLTIDRAISIVNPGAFEAGIIAPSGGNGIVVSAGATDAVSLRGLTIDGARCRAERRCFQ